MIYLEPTDLAFMNTDQLIQESIDFQKIKSSVKEKAQRFVEWVGKCVKYIRSIIARHIKLKRAEKIQKEMDDLMKREGWNIKLDDIDIPGDEYENMFEAAEQYLIGDLTESDIKTFAKNVLLNKKVILNFATKLIPGVSTAQLAISLPKTIAMLTPIVMDVIDTSKEIVLLKKKYAGKTKKIKNPDGTICKEMPAEVFITIDKYKKLYERILDILSKQNSGKGEQVVFKLNSTEDLIRITKIAATKLENNTEFNNLLRKMEDFMTTVNVESETKFDETSLSVNYKNIPNSCIECMMMMLNVISDSVSTIGTFYVNNIEYTIDTKPVISEIQPVMTDVMNLAINVIKDINTLESTGEKALIVAKKLITKYAGKVISVGIKADNNAKERGITNNEEAIKKLLVPARNMKESYDIYTEAKKPEKVIDGYLGDLPENLQSDVMEIHKLVIKTVDEILNTRDYSDLKNDKWAKEQLEEFCAMPADKSDIGSIRVYQRGKKYRCMIQLTGHFTNHMNDFNQELMHEFIKNVFVTVRPKIRKKYDFTITNEGDHGNPFEGFDVFPNPKLVEEIWNKLSDRNIKTVMEESVGDSDILSTRIDSYSGHILMLSFSNYMTEMVKNHTDIEENINMIENWNSSMFTDNTMVEASKLFKITSKSLIPFVEQCERELLRDDLNADDTIMYMERFERVQELQEYLSENESAEFTESSIQYNRVSGKLKDLPKGFQKFAIKTNEEILEAVLTEMQRHKDFDSLDDDDVKELINWMDAKNNEDGYGYFFIEKDKDDKNFAGEMRLFPKTGKEFGYISRKLEAIWNKSLKYVFDKKHSAINKKDPTKKLTLVTDENIYTLVFVFSREYAEKLYNYCINPRRFPLTESASIEENETYNVDMTESEAKRTLGTLTASIINDMNNKKPVSQYTANIYANIITKNLLPLWSKGYRKLSIKINDDNKNLSVFEFKIPSMTQDFVSRVINGRESINGLLHRTPEIKIVMSASLFNTIKDRNDAYNFFKAAVKYYDSQVEKYSMKLISEIMKLNHEMKHLIATTKLSGLVTYPMTLLFAFDNIDMSNKDCFKIDSEDLVKVTKFIKSIYTRYASPEKEKKEIINDLRVLIRTLKESLEVDENIKNLSYLPEAVDTLMSGGFDNEMNKAHNQFIYENTDLSWPASSPDPQVKYLSEKFGVKKLKKIPADLVAYIQIETESIRDANDKMMIASYCLSKIEIVEWYIELLEVGSKKYIVPHNKPYLETVRTQLLQCYKEIMAVKITNPNDRPLIDIKYPKGYEG